MTAQNSTPRFRPGIRVFFSSTYSGLMHERNALQKQVFPKLEHLCGKSGFQAIDLRWSVSTKGAREEAIPMRK
jgi:hypothetical protein